MSLSEKIDRISPEVELSEDHDEGEVTKNITVLTDGTVILCIEDVDECERSITIHGEDIILWGMDYNRGGETTQPTGQDEIDALEYFGGQFSDYLKGRDLLDGPLKTLKDYV